MNKEYLNTWNFDLNVYYGYMWDNDTLDKYRERMEKYYDRINKYMISKKTKNLIFEHGAYNMNVDNVQLSDKYELHIFLNDSKMVLITLEEMINNNIQLRYDRKYHCIHFTNIY